MDYQERKDWVARGMRLRTYDRDVEALRARRAGTPEAGEVAAMLTETERDCYKLGAIWHTSWGYDQTQVEFFEVVRETLGTVTLRRIGAEVGEGRLHPVPGTWATDCLLESDQDSHERDEARGYSEKVCRKPRMDRDGYARRSLRIDDCRYAWPYEGGGCYDTDAAGLPGR